MKTKEELNALKAEAEALNAKLCELTGDELAQVSGGLTAEPGLHRTMLGDAFAGPASDAV